jgi:hypothetical protein
MQKINYIVRDYGPDYADRWGFYILHSNGDFAGEGWHLSDNADQPNGCCIYTPNPHGGSFPWLGRKARRNLPKGTRRCMASLLRMMRRDYREVHGY